MSTEAMWVRMEKMVREVQNTLCVEIEEIDGTLFREDAWTRDEGGHGLSRVLQNGTVFEKAGVNISTITGMLSSDAARTARVGEDDLKVESRPFRVTSISLVIHPHNPFAPSAHAHYRYFEYITDASLAVWYFSGSVDLTPSYLFEEDASHFHRVHKEVCDRCDVVLYPRFKQACDAYFYLPHRGEHRGVGGLFLGNLNDREPDILFALVADCAQSFLPAYLPLIERRKAMPFTDAHKSWQRQRRGRYVEFNLVCDRGTAFGLKTGGRTESILMSLPLVAGWEYDFHPEAGSEEARMFDVLQHPRQWV